MESILNWSIHDHSILNPYIYRKLRYYDFLYTMTIYMFASWRNSKKKQQMHDSTPFFNPFQMVYMNFAMKNLLE